MKATATMLAVVVFITAGTAPGHGQVAGYATDTRGEVIRDSYNLCWRTGYWTPALARIDCDPDLVPKPVPRVAPTPMPSATPRSEPELPPPPPPPIVTPAPPPTPKMCSFSVRLSADASFDFGAAALKPTARSQLDGVIERLGACAQIDVINVNGHSDRIGDALVNQRLSERRAEAVRDYMVGKGVAASDIEIYGFGKTLPIQSCPDTKDRKALIECLAPNRRIEIDVKGLAR